MKKLIACVLFSVMLLSCTENKTDLSLHLKEGETYMQVTTSSLALTQEIQGQKMDNDIEIVASNSYTVTAFKNDTYFMDARFDKISMLMTTPQGDIKFGSEVEVTNNPYIDIMSKLMKAMVGIPFQVEMNKYGKVTDVKGIEKLFNSALDGFPEFNEMQREQLKAQLAKTYGGNTIKGNMDMVTAVFPDKAVALGDIWTIKVVVDTGYPLNITTKYKFDSEEADYYVIKGTSTIECNTMDKDYAEGIGVPAKYNLEGTMASTIKVDKTTGWIVDATAEEQIKGSMLVKFAEGQEGTTIPLTLNQNLKVSNKN